MPRIIKSRLRRLCARLRILRDRVGTEEGCMSKRMKLLLKNNPDVVDRMVTEMLIETAIGSRTSRKVGKFGPRLVAQHDFLEDIEW